MALHVCRHYRHDEPAFRTLWIALCQLVRVAAPIIPFLSEHLWQVLVTDPCAGAPDSVFLAGWPEARPAPGDEARIAAVSELRRVVALGRRARADAGIKLRQPLARLFVRGAPLAAAHEAEISEELRVRQVGFEQGPVVAVRMLPDLRRVGPRLGARLREVKRALQAGEFEERSDGSLLAAGELLAPEEVIRGERHVLPGWAIAEEDGLSVAFDTAIDDGLRIEGRVYDLIHRLNAMRREQGLALTDRVIVTLPARERDLEPHFGWISSEVLAREVRFDPAIAEPTVALA